MDELVQKVIEAVKKSGLSQQVLANELGVTFATINSWINQRSIPRRSKKKIIDKLWTKYTGKGALSPLEFEVGYLKIAEFQKDYSNILRHILSRPDLLEYLVTGLTYHSNGIEGSTLTMAETSAVIYGGSTLKHRSLREQIEAKNHKSALIFLFEYLNEKNKIDLEFIRKLHLIVMNGIIDNAGNYRTHPVRIGGTKVVTANYMKVPELMEKLIDTHPEKKVRDISVISKFHADFEKIHPFPDGNGRVGRLILNAMLLESGFAPAVIEKDKKHLYYTYIETAEENGDYSHLELFILDAVLDSYRKLE